MSVTSTEPASTDPVRTDPRGRLELHRRVVEKVAAQAASEVSAGGRSGGVLGLGAQTDLSARPETDVVLNAGTATIRVSVGLPYPAPLRAATDAVRRQVADRVEELTSIPVHRVDVDVRWLSRDAGTGRTVR